MLRRAVVQTPRIRCNPNLHRSWLHHPRTVTPWHTLLPLRACATKSEPPKPDPSVGATPVLPLELVSKPWIQKSLPMIGNVAYLTLAGGFMMTDVLSLRCLLAAGYVSLVCYHAFQFRPLRIPLAGSFFFVIVNTYFGVKIYMERQVHLDEDEKGIHKEYFAEEMMDYEFEKVIRAGVVHNVEKDAERLLKAGDMHENLFFILEGKMEVTFADESHVAIEKGEFVGEGSFIGKPHKSNSNVDALPGCRYVQWNLQKMKDLVKTNPHAQRALEVKIGRELAHKLKHTSQRLAKAEHHLLVMRLCFGSKKDTVEEALGEAFKKYDTDGGGTLDFEEFSAMMKQLDSSDSPVTSLQLRNLFDAVDADGGGSISVDEFLEWLNK